MSASPWQRRIARAIRITPGMSRVRDRVLPAIRSNQLVADVATRLFPPHFDLASSIVPLKAGALAGPDVDRLPIIAVIATGLPGEEAAERLLADLTDLQRDSPTFRPLVLGDAPAFAAARAHQVVWEHLLTEQEHDAALPPGSSAQYADYCARRLLSLMLHYHSWYTLHLRDGRLDATDRAVVRALGSLLPRDLDVHPR